MNQGWTMQPQGKELVEWGSLELDLLAPLGSSANTKQDQMLAQPMYPTHVMEACM